MQSDDEDREVDSFADFDLFYESVFSPRLSDSTYETKTVVHRLYLTRSLTDEEIDKLVELRSDTLLVELKCPSGASDMFEHNSYCMAKITFIPSSMPIKQSND